MSEPRRTGVIVHVSSAGLGIVEEAETHANLAFTFDQIRGYHGEYPGEIGIRVGRTVVFSKVGDRVVEIDLEAR